MKLELKHLAPYLPYNLSYNYTNLDRVSVLTSDEIARREKLGTLDKIKPILRPLSDLTKEIEHKREVFIPIEELAFIGFPRFFKEEYAREVVLECDTAICKRIMPPHPGLPDMKPQEIFFQVDIDEFGFDCGVGDDVYIVDNPHLIIQKLYEWHFDVFGLIEKGLAIDINSAQ